MMVDLSRFTDIEDVGEPPFVLSEPPVVYPPPPPDVPLPGGATRFTNIERVNDLVETPEGQVLTPPGFLTGGDMGEPSDEIDAVVDQSSVGRILDAIGEWASEGWGPTRIGLTPASVQALSNAGIFKDVTDASIQPLRAMNQAVIRPLAASLDALVRSGNAVIYGVAGGAGALADEVGLSDLVGLPGERLARDILQLTEVIGVVFGASPARVPRAQQPKHNMLGSDSAPTVATQKFRDIDGEETPVPPPELVRQDKAGNINLAKINVGEDVKDVIRSVALENDDFIVRRQGVVPHQVTNELADSMGMTPEELLKTKVGTNFNAVEQRAASQLLVNSAEDVRNKVLAAERGGDAELLDLELAITRHTDIQGVVAGVRAEAGRALNILKQRIDSTLDAEGIEELLASRGGRDKMHETIARMRQFNSPQQLSKFIRENSAATFGDMAVEAWINALLSAPQTHVTNIISNSLVSLLSVPESLIAAGVSAVRRGKGTDKVYAGEALQRLYGFGQGGLEGLRTGWRAFRDETTSGLNKLEQPRQTAIPSKIFTIGERKFEVGGKQFRIPGRALTAMDEMFKAIGYRQEMNAQAYRIAKSEGLSGHTLAARMAELIEAPTTAMQKAATATAAYQTFTKPLGKAGQHVQGLSNSQPLLKIPFTFVRTPVNIMKYAGERTILSLASQSVRGKIFKEGRLSKKGSLTLDKPSVAQSEQMARIIMGSGIAAGAWGLVSSGLITGGGPADTRERSLKYTTGWQPYSVRIGEMNYSFARGEPIGTLVGVMADVHEIQASMTDGETSDVAALITMSIARNVLSKTWTKGASDLVEALQDPERYGERYIRNLIGTVVPTVSAQVARANDPYLREVRTILDAVKARIPGLSQSLLPRRDVWGEPIRLEGSLGPDLISPIYESTVKNDPVNRELLSLKVYPAAISRRIRGVELTPKQYDELQLISGRSTKQQLDAVVALPGWYKIPPFARVKVIKELIEKTRDVSRKSILIRHPTLLKSVFDHQLKLMGQEPVANQGLNAPTEGAVPEAVPSAIGAR